MQVIKDYASVLCVRAEMAHGTFPSSTFYFNFLEEKVGGSFCSYGFLVPLLGRWLLGTQQVSLERQAGHDF